MDVPPADSGADVGGLAEQLRTLTARVEALSVRLDSTEGRAE